MLDMHCSSCPCSASLPGILHNPSCLLRWGVKGLEELFWDTVPDLWNTHVKYSSLQALNSLSTFFCQILTTQTNISAVIPCPDFGETVPFFSSIGCFLMHWAISTRVVGGLSGVPGHQWESVDNGRGCRAPQPLSMNQLYPEEAGPEQESPCNSVVKGYSEGRELGDRSQHY